MSISEKLNTISTSLGDIKDAIIDKGQTPSGNITTYAEAISNISGGGQTINNQNKTVTTNGVYTADTGYTGLGEVTVSVQPNLQDKTVTVNGVVTADIGYDGLGEVTVDVPQSGVTPSGTITITKNGRTDVRLYRYAYVDVPSGGNLGTKTITSNGTYSASSDNLDGFSEVTVNVSGGGTMPADETIKGLLDGSLSGDITLPNTATRLRAYALAAMNGITSITAPNVTAMGNYSIAELPNCTSISLPSFVGPAFDEQTGIVSDRMAAYFGSGIGTNVPSGCSYNLPNMTILPYMFGLYGIGSVTAGTIIGCLEFTSQAANLLGVNPFDLKVCEVGFDEFSNSNFDFTRDIDRYIDNGELTFDNLIYCGNIGLNNILINPNINTVNFPAVKYSKVLDIGEIQNDLTINYDSFVGGENILNNCSGLNTLIVNFNNMTELNNSIGGYYQAKEINFPDVTTNSGSGVGYQIEVGRINLPSLTNPGTSLFYTSTVDYLNIPSLSNYSTGYTHDSTIGTVEATSCTSFSHDRGDHCTITNLLLGGSSVVTGSGFGFNDITNIYVPDNLVSVYEADSYWSQYPQGTIKPMSDWNNAQGS